VAVAAFKVILQRCSLAKLLRQIFTEYVCLSALFAVISQRHLLTLFAALSFLQRNSVFESLSFTRWR